MKIQEELFYTFNEVGITFKSDLDNMDPLARSANDPEYFFSLADEVRQAEVPAIESGKKGRPEWVAPWDRVVLGLSQIGKSVSDFPELDEAMAAARRAYGLETEDTVYCF